MPRKRKVNKSTEEDNEEIHPPKEEIHPDFTSDIVSSSPGNSTVSDNLNLPIDNNSSDNLETPINDDSDNLNNINHGDDEPRDGDEHERSDNSDSPLIQEDEQTDNQESFDEDRGDGEGSTDPQEEDEEDELTEEDLKNLVDKEGQDDDEEEEEEEGRPIPSSVIIDEPVFLDNDSDDDSDKGSKTLEELDAEHEYKRRLRVNDFLIEYAKGINRSIDEVADKKGISPKQAREFLNGYINKVKETVLKQKYPDELIRYYNTGIKEDDRRIKIYHVDYLKPLVKKYAQYDINSNIERLNSNQSDKFISRQQVSASSSYEDNPLINSGQQHGRVSNQQQSSSAAGIEYNDVDHLFDGITSLQLIRFGLYNVFGQHARIKIGNMIGMNPTPYLVDEQKMRNLLNMATGSPQKAEYFIDWLKTNSRYVTQPEGFLRHHGPEMVQPGQQQGQQQAGLYGATPYYQNGHSSSYQADDMDLYYYQQGIYIKGFPPNHPINIQNLREYREEKAAEKQLKQMDQKMRSAIQMKMLETFDTVGGNKNNSNSFLTPEMMFLMGMGRYRQSGTDETGKPVMVFEPSFGAFGGGGQGQGQGGGSADSMTSMMGAFKEMVAFMSTMQNQNKNPDMMTQFMQVLMQKALQPESNRMEEVLKSFEVFQKLKGPEMPQMPGGVATDPEVIIKTKRMELDRDFGMKRLQLQEKELDLQRTRLEAQDKEANQNLQTLLEGAGQVVPMVLNLAQQFFMGNRGGVMGGMQGGIPGMQPGGQGAGMMPGGGTPGPGSNPAELILKMEYEKQKQQREEDAYRKRMEWEEELRRKNAEAAAMAAMRSPPPGPVQKTETERVVIKEPVVQKQQSYRETEPEDYNESMFAEFPADKLESIIRQVEKENRKMQRYKAAVETALQNKILNEDYDMFDQKQQIVSAEPHGEKVITTTKETVTIEQEQEQEQQQPARDFTEMLDDDGGGTSYRDPDWDGTETEEVIISDDNADVEQVGEGGEEKESVDI